MATKKGIKEHKELLKLQDDAHNSYRLRLIDGFDKYQKLAVTSEIEKAIISGNVDNLEKMVKWKQTALQFDKVDKKFEETFVKAGDLSAYYIPTVDGEDFIFTADSPEVKKILNDFTAERVTLINDSTKEGLKNSIAEAYDKGRSPKKTAKEISKNIGMNARQETSFRKYKASMEEKGYKQSTIDKRLDVYREKAIKQRSLVIATTELTDCTNKAQLEDWRQASKEGFISKNTMKVWIAIIDKKTSEVCSFLNNKKVKWNKYWSYKGEKYESPSAHPSCRSGMYLDV